MTEYILVGIGGVFSVLFYLLRQRDERQGKDIESLFAIHHRDVEKLTALELEIARNHYPKGELDERFRQLDATIKEGFKELGTDIKSMSKALNDHLQEDRK